jgi:site-specific recombinase XerD
MNPENEGLAKTKNEKIKSTPHESSNSLTLLEESAKKGLTNKVDVDMVLTFIRFYKVKAQLTEGSVKKYAYGIKQFLIWIKEQDKTIATLDEETTLLLIEKLQHSKWSEHTRKDYFIRFKKFYSWSRRKNGSNWNEEAYNLLVDREERVGYKIDNNEVVPKSIITEEDNLIIVEAEPSLCYKVLFSVLWESGVRSGEIFSLRIKDVDDNGDGTYTLNIPKSKTEKRSLPMETYCVKYLRMWLDAHPNKEDKNAPLFLNTLGKPLNNFSANKRLRELLIPAGIDKDKISLHSFRHGRATDLASKGMSEFQMCSWFGWKIGSRMPSTYIRRSQIDLKKALRKAEGREVEEAKQINGVKCLQCNHINSLQATYCDVCNLPLDAKKLLQVKQRLMSDKENEMLEAMIEQRRSTELDEVMKLLKKHGIK